MSEKAKTKSMEIEPLKYEGSVDDFRSWMDVFLARASSIPLVDAVSQQDVIKKATEKHKGGDILNIAQYYPQLITLYSEYAKSSKREVWRVTRVDPIHDDETIPPKKWATIMAVEVLNITTVEFLDGIYFHLLDENDKKIDYARVGFIGDDFSKYAQFIKDEWKKRNQKTGQSPQEEILSQDILERELKKIPSEKWRGAVIMWRSGMSAPEIGAKINRTARTVTNKMTIIRNVLGEKIVPYHKK